MYKVILILHKFVLKYEGGGGGGGNWPPPPAQGKTTLKNPNLIELIKGLDFYLGVIYTFNKHVWVFPLKDKKSVSTVNAFQKILNDSTRKHNKIWVDKGSEFYNNSFKKWLKEDDIEIYSIHK